MEIFYSRITNKYYLRSFHSYGEIPADSVKLTQEQLTAYRLLESKGHTRIAGEDGYPAHVEPVQPTSSQADKLIALTEKYELPSYVAYFETPEQYQEFIDWRKSLHYCVINNTPLPETPEFVEVLING